MGSTAFLLLLGLLLHTAELGVTDICKYPPEKGICNAALTYYYYDTGEGICKEFTYGGCRGNANRFKTKKACMFTCAKKGRKK